MNIEVKYFHKKRYIVWVCSIVVGIIILHAWMVPVANAAGGQAHFSIEPTFLSPYNTRPRSYFIYHTWPGAQFTDRVHITNDGTAQGTVVLYAADAVTGQNSGTMFLSQNAPKRDVGAWINIPEKWVTLNPGQSAEVPFTITVPEHVRAGQHGGGIVAEDMRQVQEKQSSNQTNVQIGVQDMLALGVLIDLPGAQIEQLQGTGISYNQASRYQSILIGLKNTGDTLLYPSGEAQIRDTQGRLLQKIPLNLHTFLPQTEIEYPVYMQHKALPLGQTYSVKLHLTYGHQHTLDYSGSFLAPAPIKAPLQAMVQSLVTAPMAANDQSGLFWYIVLAMGCVLVVGGGLFFWFKKNLRDSKRVPERPKGVKDRKNTEIKKSGTEKERKTREIDLILR